MHDINTEILSTPDTPDAIRGKVGILPDALLLALVRSGRDTRQTLASMSPALPRQINHIDAVLTAAIDEMRLRMIRTGLEESRAADLTDDTTVTQFIPWSRARSHAALTMARFGGARIH